jgi:hypothetical protein
VTYPNFPITYSAEIRYRRQCWTLNTEIKFTTFKDGFQAYSTPGLPDGIFSNQKSQFGYFWRVLDWKMSVYFSTIWPILRQCFIFYDHLVIEYIFPRFGILCQEKCRMICMYACLFFAFHYNLCMYVPCVSIVTFHFLPSVGQIHAAELEVTCLSPIAPIRTK